MTPGAGWLSSLAGRVMDPGTYTETLDSGALAPGIYICILQTRSGRSAVKFAATRNEIMKSLMKKVLLVMVIAGMVQTHDRTDAGSGRKNRK
ncbi:MAG: hypothetical protein MZV63_21125 [Marinilabiliales bacterium]|nr:hypothetical protein [Marinilabiliales bacterium]